MGGWFFYCIFIICISFLELVFLGFRRKYIIIGPFKQAKKKKKRFVWSRFPHTKHLFSIYPLSRTPDKRSQLLSSPAETHLDHNHTQKKKKAILETIISIPRQEPLPLLSQPPHLAPLKKAPAFHTLTLVLLLSLASLRPRLSRLLPATPDHNHTQETSHNCNPDQNQNDRNADRPHAWREQVVELVALVHKGHK